VYRFKKPCSIVRVRSNSLSLSNFFSSSFRARSYTRTRKSPSSRDTFAYATSERNRNIISSVLRGWSIDVNVDVGSVATNSTRLFLARSQSEVWVHDQRATLAAAPTPSSRSERSWVLSCSAPVSSMSLLPRVPNDLFVLTIFEVCFLFKENKQLRFNLCYDFVWLYVIGGRSIFESFMFSTRFVHFQLYQTKAQSIPSENLRLNKGETKIMQKWSLPQVWDHLRKQGKYWLKN